MIKAGWVRTITRRRHGPPILALAAAFVSPVPLRARGSFTAGGVNAMEPQPSVQSVREEMPHGEIV